ncbi:MAG: hypothetical protein ACJATA_001832 [Sphingobacteriales bacterium]|jgi:membrane protein implicated in regulation of membrane protease activity
MTLFEILNTPEVIWFLLGLLFFALEFAVPGLILLFFGIGAWVTCIVCLALPIETSTQLWIFILTSVVTLAALRKYLLNRSKNKKNHLADDNYEFINQSAIAETHIIPGKTGLVQFKGASWQAIASDEVTQGDKVIITGKESIVLQVKPAK